MNNLVSGQQNFLAKWFCVAFGLSVVGTVAMGRDGLPGAVVPGRAGQAQYHAHAGQLRLHE